MKLIIHGGKELKGEIKVSGAKNAALKMIAASILIDGNVTLKNVPEITDVKTMAQIFEYLGGSVVWGKNTLKLNSQKINKYELPPNLSKSLRGSIVFIGPLVSKFGKCIVPWPGGCAIGKRPLTAHTEIFKTLRVKSKIKGNLYKFEKIDNNLLNTAKLIERSVTATENAILYCAKNKSIILENVAAEPEIDDLIKLLNASGAKIKRLSDSKIKISNSTNLKGNINHEIIGDRIEAGTWISAGLLLGSNLKVIGFNPEHIQNPIDLIKKIGADIKVEKDSVVVNKSNLGKFYLKTGVYPQFPTDLQSPFSILATQAQGTSTIEETLFDDRLKYLPELQEMGAKVKIISDHKAQITGPIKLQGKIIESTDLRSGATMVLAGLIADGKTTVSKAEIIDRGYDMLDDKLSAVGADIKRVE